MAEPVAARDLPEPDVMACVLAAAHRLSRIFEVRILSILITW
jgi:hypothetical protein